MYHAFGQEGKSTDIELVGFPGGGKYKVCMYKSSVYARLCNSVGLIGLFLAL